MIPRALPVDDDQLEHLVPGERLDRAGRDLALEGLVGADQQLLAGLAAGVERAGHLYAAERAVVQQAAVLPGERDALGDALVDDVGADLGQAVDVRLAGAVVAALDRVVEETVDRVAVLLVVLGGVDPALRGDRVRATRGVLVAEGLHVVAGLAERGRRRGAGQAGADDDDVDSLRRLDGLTSRASNLRFCQRSAIGPVGRLGVDDRLAGGVVAGGVVGHLGRGVLGARPRPWWCPAFRSSWDPLTSR